MRHGVESMSNLCEVVLYLSGFWLPTAELLR
jgi:hypothetical protein